MPWPYAQKAGIVKKWADKYGVTINFVQVNDYVESVNQFNAGKLDGVTVTNMDALTIPAAGGKDTSAIILGDYSDGNDGIVLKNASSIADINVKAAFSCRWRSNIARSVASRISGTSPLRISTSPRKSLN